uniref:C2 domain-containing protein n=1 Tax=Macrostomum lignano TaxID=282301 RepID=A0A1I8IVZ1_9PLAT
EHSVGDLQFSMSYLPSAKRLSVSIMKARNLREAHKDRPLGDSSVRAILTTQSGKKQKRKKTSSCKTPSNPTWEEALVFNGVVEEDLKRGSLELIVCHDGVLSSTEISRVYLGPDTGGDEYQHWWNMSVPGRTSGPSDATGRPVLRILGRRLARRLQKYASSSTTHSSTRNDRPTQTVTPRGRERRCRCRRRPVRGFDLRPLQAALNLTVRLCWLLRRAEASGPASSARTVSLQTRLSAKRIGGDWRSTSKPLLGFRWNRLTSQNGIETVLVVEAMTSVSAAPRRLYTSRPVVAEVGVIGADHGELRAWPLVDADVQTNENVTRPLTPSSLSLATNCPISEPNCEFSGTLNVKFPDECPGKRANSRSDL